MLLGKHQRIYLYTIFCFVAMAVNLIAQRIMFLIVVSELEFYIAISVGTLLGLVCKYILDKKFIFFHQSKSFGENYSLFFMYSFFGIFTTLIFWSVEALFWFAFRTHLMRDIGAISGLSLGYIIKYRLDKAYIFRARGVIDVR